MPKRGTLIRSIACVLLIMIMTASFGSALSGTGVVVGDNAVVRVGSGFDENAVGMLSIGTRLEISEEREGWYRVESTEPTLSGWMYQDLVALLDTGNGASVRKGVVNASILNVRVSPSTDAQRINQLREGQEVRIIRSQDEWLQIVMTDSQKGWVHGDYITEVPNKPSAAVNQDKTPLYPVPGGGGQPLQELESGTIVYIHNYKSDYYQVETNEGSGGWIARDQVSLIINGVNPVSRGSFRGAGENEFIRITKSYLGSPYRYASAGPTRFDCSGFVYYILHQYYGHLLKEHNINLPRSSRTMAGVGTPVNRNALEVGDLVFFNNTGGSINHVGFYIGNNQFIHASSGASMSVIVSSLNEANYNRRYNTARRLF